MKGGVCCRATDCKYNTALHKTLGFGMCKRDSIMVSKDGCERYDPFE